MGVSYHRCRSKIFDVLTAEIGVCDTKVYLHSPGSYDNHIHEKCAQAENSWKRTRDHGSIGMKNGRVGGYTAMSMDVASSLKTGYIASPKD